MTPSERLDRQFMLVCATFVGLLLSFGALIAWLGPLVLLAPGLFLLGVVALAVRGGYLKD